MRRVCDTCVPGVAQAHPQIDATVVYCVRCGRPLAVMTDNDIEAEGLNDA